MVRVLIWEGQDVNEPTVIENNTPLHFAARNGHYLIAKYLLGEQADATIENAFGLTAWNVLQNSISDTIEKERVIMSKLKAKTSPAYEAVKLRMKMLRDTEELLNDESNRGKR